jgi:hypothetical protein
MLQSSREAPFACSRRFGATNEKHPTTMQNDRADPDEGVRWVLPLEFLHGLLFLPAFA